MPTLRTARASLRRSLSRQPALKLAKRRIERHATGRDPFEIVEKLALFRPNSAGYVSSVATLTLRAAQDTIPLLVRLASLGSGQSPTSVSVDVYDGNGEDARRLADLFSIHGSDKSTVHQYHRVYASLLGDPRSATAVLEIGLGTNNRDVVSTMGAGGRPGASLRAFRDYLPNARIFGADIDERILFSENRIETHWVDQTDTASLNRLGGSLTVKFDLIIDDGLHSPNANLAVLLFGLDRLRVGGSLVIEDIALAALPAWNLAARLLPDTHEGQIVIDGISALFIVTRLR